MGELYLFLDSVHSFIGRAGLAIAIGMFALGFFIGVVHKQDVTQWYRRTAYAIAGIMLLQAVVGLAMYFVIGVRPYEEVHWIYGLGAVLALPFFIFVERTAKKRPAMGSYIWGFAVLAGIIVRGIMTGAA